MRNQPIKNHTRDYLDLQDELYQHIQQAQAIIDYLSVDIGENGDFCASNKTVGGMIWAVQTLLDNALNAIKTADEYRVNVEARNEK